MTKANSYCTIEVPASLRSDRCSPSARNAVRVPFGIRVHLHRNPHTDVNEELTDDPTYGVDELRSLIESLVFRKIGAAPDQFIVEQIYNDLDGASLEQFACRIKARLTAITSYGLLRLLASDCAKSKRQWIESRKTAGILEDHEITLAARAFAQEYRNEYRKA